MQTVRHQSGLGVPYWVGPVRPLRSRHRPYLACGCGELRFTGREVCLEGRFQSTQAIRRRPVPRATSTAVDQVSFGLANAP